VGFYLAMAILGPAIWFCVIFDFPHQLLARLYPLRWVLLVALVTYLWWVLPPALASRKKNRQASR
jgi:hypothetical protein